MASTVAGILLTGVHGSRPASGVSIGTLYSCTTHSLVYQTSDTGSTWTTWANLAGTGSTTTVATDTIWDAAGDLVQGTGADTAAKLTAGLSGQALISAGAAAANAWKYPPGYEFDYVEITSNVSITATTAATANTAITGSAVTYDGSTIIKIDFFTSAIISPGGQSIEVVLYDGASQVAKIATLYNATIAYYVPGTFSKRLTPSNASHTYSIRAFVSGGTGTIQAAASGANTNTSAFIRITKV